MKKEIDLLRAKAKIPEKEVRLQRLSKIGSSLLLVFYILFLGGVFSFWMIQQREAGLIKDKIGRTENEVKRLEKIESLQTALKGRLKALAPIFEEQDIDYKEALTMLEQLTPSGVSLESFDLKKSGEIVISGAADTSLSLGEFLVGLTDPEKEFKNITLSSVRRTEEGFYNFSLKLVIES